MTRTNSLVVGLLVTLLLGGLVWGLINALQGDPRDGVFTTDDQFLDSSGDEGSVTPRRTDDRGAASHAEAANSGLSTVASGQLAPSGEMDEFGLPFALLSVRVVDLKQQPVADVELELVVDHGDEGRGPIEGNTLRRVQTDIDGHAVLQDVASYEAYVLLAHHSAFAVLHRSGLRVGVGEVKELTLMLHPGETVHGIVRDGSGDPISGALVTVYDTSIMVLDENRRIERTALTDRQGRYQIPAIGGGFKNIVAEAAGHADGAHSGVNVHRLSGTKSIDFSLARGGTVDGRVLTDDGRPVSDAIVSIQAVRVSDGRTDYHHPVRTDKLGQFLVEGLREQMSYLISARKVGFSGLMARKNVETGDHGISLTLHAQLRLSGRVVDDETGEPVTAFWLVSSPTPHLRQLSRRTSQKVLDKGGRFQFHVASLAPNMKEIHLFALTPGTAGGSQRLQLVPRNQPLARPLKVIDGIELRVRKGGVITGRVVDHKGGGVAGARIELLGALSDDGGSGKRFLFERTLQKRFERPVNVTHSASDGRFELTGVMGGEWRLRVHHDFLSSLDVDDSIEILGEETRDVGSLVLRAGGRVWGRVRDGDHKPEEGAVVHLVPVPGADGARRRHRTDLTGSFDFRGIPPGWYFLSVTERKGVATYRTLLRSGQDAAVAASATGAKILVEEGGEVHRDL